MANGCFFLYDSDRCSEAAEIFQRMPGVTVPGLKAVHHAFWLFPIVVAQPAKLVDAMQLQGYDITQGTTQLGTVDRYTPVDQQTELFRRLFPHDAKAMMDKYVLKRCGGTAWMAWAAWGAV